MSVSSKVAVILGGASGAGPSIAYGISKNFAGHVYITGRDFDQCERAVDTIEVKGVRVKFHQLDTSNQQSVEQFVKYIREYYGGVDIFVNNEGVKTIDQSLHKTMTRSERANYYLDNNYFHVTEICEWMFPLLRPYARIVQVSNAGGHLGLIPSESLRTALTDPDLTQVKLANLLRSYLTQLENGVDVSLTWGTDPEVVSKTALTTLTMIQQRIFDEDLETPGIVVNAVHPGYLEGEDTHDLGQALFTPDRASKVPLRLALQKNSDFAVKGQYVWFDNRSVHLR